MHCCTAPTLFHRTAAKHQELEVITCHSLHRTSLYIIIVLGSRLALDTMFVELHTVSAQDSIGKRVSAHHFPLSGDEKSDTRYKAQVANVQVLGCDVSKIHHGKTKSDERRSEAAHCERCLVPPEVQISPSLCKSNWQFNLTYRVCELVCFFG